MPGAGEFDGGAGKRAVKGRFAAGRARNCSRPSNVGAILDADYLLVCELPSKTSRGPPVCGQAIISQEGQRRRNALFAATLSVPINFRCG